VVVQAVKRKGQEARVSVPRLFATYRWNENMSRLRSLRRVGHPRRDLCWQNLSLKRAAPTLGGKVLAVEESQQAMGVFQGLQGPYQHRIELEASMRTGLVTRWKRGVRVFEVLPVLVTGERPISSISRF
jgi:hypothetical protein